LIYLAVVVNCVGTLGFVRAMAYFDNVIIAVATLLEPMLASFIARAFHVGELPGPLGWCGNLLVAIGTLNVIYPSLDNKEKAMH
jgi:drug/metabolite transporter (DMT)-like permease